MTLWTASLLAPWFSIDNTSHLPNLHGHGPSSFTHRVQDTLWLWELDYAWPFGLCLLGWLLGLRMAARGFRTGSLVLLTTWCATGAFVVFQWKLEGMWLTRELHLGPLVALLGASLMTLGGLAGWSPPENGDV